MNYRIRSKTAGKSERCCFFTSDEEKTIHISL
jgi:hypothetical protein